MTQHNLNPLTPQERTSNKADLTILILAEARISACLVDLWVNYRRALAQIDTLEAELAEAQQIINRVWAALGITSYAEAQGKTIYEIVAALKAERQERALGEEAREELKDAATEFLRVESKIRVALLLGLASSMALDRLLSQSDTPIMSYRTELIDQTLEIQHQSDCGVYDSPATLPKLCTCGAANAALNEA